MAMPRYLALDLGRAALARARASAFGRRRRRRRPGGRRAVVELDDVETQAPRLAHLALLLGVVDEDVAGARRA